MGDFAFQVITQDRLGRAYWQLGDFRRAIESCERSMSLLKGKPVGERFGMAGVASVVTPIPLVVSLVELGYLANGIAQGKEIVRIAEKVGVFDAKSHLHRKRRSRKGYSPGGA